MIEGRGALFAPLDCAKCGKPFTANVRTVVCFYGRPVCLKCITEVNELRVRLGAPPWGIPENAYPKEMTNGEG